MPVAEVLKAHCAPLSVWNNKMCLFDVWISLCCQAMLIPTHTAWKKIGLRAGSCSVIMKWRWHWYRVGNQGEDTARLAAWTHTVAERRTTRRLLASLRGQSCCNNYSTCTNPRALIIFKLCCCSGTKPQSSWGSRLLMQHKGVFRRILQCAQAPVRFPPYKWRNTRDSRPSCSSPLHTDWSGLLNGMLSRQD